MNAANGDAHALDAIELDAEAWRSQAGLCELLGRLWAEELSPTTLSWLSEPAVAEAFQAAGGVLPAAAELEPLAIEYCRLFIGPRDHLPPLQSVWQGGALMGEAAQSVMAFVDALPPVVKQQLPEPDKLMPDHLGYQLMVMASVCRQIAERLEVSGDVASSSDAMQDCATELDFARLIVHRHLSWTQPLLAGVQARSQHPFYSALATITRDALADTASAVGSDRATTQA